MIQQARIGLNDTPKCKMLDFEPPAHALILVILDIDYLNIDENRIREIPPEVLESFFAK